MNFAVPLKIAEGTFFSIQKQSISGLPNIPVEQEQPGGHHDCQEDGDPCDEEPGDEAAPLLGPDADAHVGRGPDEDDEGEQAHPQQPGVPRHGDVWWGVEGEHFDGLALIMSVPGMATNVV